MVESLRGGWLTPKVLVGNARHSTVFLPCNRRCTIPARAKIMPHHNHNGRVTLMSPLVMEAGRENAKTGAIKLKSGEVRQMRRSANKTGSHRVQREAETRPTSS